jgi:hypothetical protein
VLQVVARLRASRALDRVRRLRWRDHQVAAVQDPIELGQDVAPIRRQARPENELGELAPL